MSEKAQASVEPVGGAPALYELSGGYVTGFVAALRTLGFYEEALAAVPEPVRQVLGQPSARRWWPPDAVDAAATRVLERHGEKAVEDIGRAITVHSVRGYVKIALALAGGDPAKILGQVGALAQASVRGVEVVFQPLGPGRGRIEVRYNGVAPHGAGLLWRGAFCRLVEATRINGAQIGPMEYDGAATFGYGVTWV